MTTEPEPLDRLVAALRAQGLDPAADRLHAVASATYTTSSEFLGELGLEMARLRKAHGNSFSPETVAAFQACVKAVRLAWPTMGGLGIGSTQEFLRSSLERLVKSARAAWRAWRVER